MIKMDDKKSIADLLKTKIEKTASDEESYRAKKAGESIYSFASQDPQGVYYTFELKARDIDYYKILKAESSGERKSFYKQGLWDAYTSFKDSKIISFAREMSQLEMIPEFTTIEKSQLESVTKAYFEQLPKRDYTEEAKARTWSPRSIERLHFQYAVACAYFSGTLHAEETAESISKILESKPYLAEDIGEELRIYSEKGFNYNTEHLHWGH
jgi:hypothetical protein